MYLILIVGSTGQGKTFYTKKLLEGKKTLIFDVNNEYGEENESLANKSDYIKFTPNKTVTMQSKSIPSRARYIDGDIKDFVSLASLCTDRIIVFEDATGFIKGRTSNAMDKLMAKRRHVRQTIILQFHSIDSIPPRIAQLSNILILFKTQDEEKKVKTKYSNFHKEFVMLQKGYVKQPIEKKLI
jgi:DNA helicase HerA-like ATPase